MEWLFAAKSIPQCGDIEQGVRGRETSRKFGVGIAIEVLSPKGAFACACIASATSQA
jgi:hypothetical protein